MPIAVLHKLLVEALLAVGPLLDPVGEDDPLAEEGSTDDQGTAMEAEITPKMGA